MAYIRLLVAIFFEEKDQKQCYCYYFICVDPVADQSLYPFKLFAATAALGGLHVLQ